MHPLIALAASLVLASSARAEAPSCQQGFARIKPESVYLRAYALPLAASTLAAAGPAQAEYQRPADDAITGPKYLYHVGYRPEMETDLQARTIPQDVWDKFIMNGSGNFNGLPAFRRGFYGVEPGAIATISQYGVKEWKKGREFRVIKIHLADECRRYGKINAQYTNISRDNPDKFSQWMIQRLPKMPKEMRDACYSERDIHWSNGRTDHVENWEFGTYFDTNADTREARQAATCGDEIHRFFEAEKIKLVADDANGVSAGSTRSWAIRDRACIENLTGSPDELLRETIVDPVMTLDADSYDPASLLGWEAPDIEEPFGFTYAIGLFAEARSFRTTDWPAVARRFNAAFAVYMRPEPEGFTIDDVSVTPGDQAFQHLYRHLMSAASGCARKRRLAQLQDVFLSWTDWLYSRKKACGKADAADPICRWGATSYTKSEETKATVPDISRMVYDSANRLVYTAEELCSGR